MMYEEYDEREDGLSLLEIIKVAFGTNKVSRIRFGIVIVVLAIAFYIIVGVFYNNSKTEYVANFQYQIPSLIENKSSDGKIVSYSYLDGSPFNINSLTTLNNLENAKNSSDKFEKVDVNRIYEDSAFSISYDSDLQYQFSISINNKYFSNKEEAKLFVEELVKLPLSVTKDLVSKTDNSLYLKQAIDDDSTLIEEITNLINQGEHIISAYKSMVESAEKTGLSFVTINGKLYSITEIMNVVSARIKKLDLDQLSNEVESNHYVRNYNDESVQNYLKTKRDNLYYESNQLKQIIDEYNDILNGSTITANLEQYVAYIDRKAAVDKELSVYQEYINNGKPSDEIEPKITNAYNELEELTDELNVVQKASYREDLTTIYFKKNSIVEEVGQINTLIIVVISIIGGVVISGIVNIILGVGKYKASKLEDSKAKKENTEN